MPFLLRIASAIDRFSQRTGRLIYWLTLAMVLVGAFNALARYTARFTGLSLSSNTYIELQWYLFSMLFLLGAAYALQTDSHVRVDVLYGRLSRKGKAWIDLMGTVLFLIPFCVLMLWVSWPSVINSWAVLEGSPDPGGLPRYPIKTVIPIAFLFLLAQAFSMLIRSLAAVVGYEPPAGEEA
ncbi:MAG: TRAP-type mannitol/chloroaromatic compound transport system permease small subunit [Rhodothermales bacterium]|jgi:TRAP-type mannitol/chloroaromatic compound transport system permease small subunit